MSKDSGVVEDTRSKTWTVLALLRWTTGHFKDHGLSSPRLDAEVLLAHVLQIRRLDLYLKFEQPVMSEERARYRELIALRVSERVPVSILVGEKEFWSRSFRVNSDVLTPRPDTETLVEASLDRMADPERAYRVLDLGTGSGAIALSLALERPAAQITATDLSSAALQIARKNAEELQVEETVEFREGSLFEPLGHTQFDLIVSNPPYLAERDSADLPAELKHEPSVALFGGVDGYRVLEPLAAEAIQWLSPGGWLLLEMDPAQIERVGQWLSDSGLGVIETLRDLAGRDRVLVARRPQEVAEAEPTSVESMSSNRGDSQEVAP
ncbi:MAG: peptide chain release factor N(5)-glutamine methyltransferase [Myxococcota bacterium]|nr:peptide chain release factor N(5)-glutamine methyltransferase [Myxococcota bacterium]